MSDKSLFLILLSGVLLNNYVLQSFLGVSAFMGHAKNAAKAVYMGLAVTAVMLISTLITWPVQTMILNKNGLGYFQAMAFMVIILIVVYVLNAVVKFSCKKSLGVCFPLIALNSAVLGVCINNVSEGLSFVQAVVSSAGVGLGFLLAMVVFAGVRSTIEECFVPKAFRGLPVNLMAAAIVSLVLFAF